ncbi:YlbF family regulator [Neobacillus sp. PS3-40]|uniref:YlbF family regulator n=1 Tax=Neobacillus sp. PS3-40 TaxID=3070679 RepID=UPI0027E1E76A|nr:YlbF family regulator [Neobacillus sp. PS3-40]WML43439.1 YlbF family regulator [Neobacillus sp. PS3-40]
MRPKPDMEEIRVKTEELCQLIIDQAAFPELRAMINDFFVNEEAKFLYNDVMEKQRALQQKQQQGLQLSREDINVFDEAREKIYLNPVSRDFLYASQELDKVQNLVIKYVLKTVELERIPTEEDLIEEGCGCGGSCSCGGH